MRDLFNETFEKETMPDCSKRRVRNHLLEVFDEVQKPKKKRAVGKISAIACSIAVFLISGVTVIAANADLRESIAEGVKGLFISKEKAVTEVYKGKNVEEYVRMIEDHMEKSTFDEEELQLQLVSYMGDTNGVQILLQYAVNEKFPHAFPSAESVKLSGVEEAYVIDQSWINSDDNHGYWMLYISVPENGIYTLTVENFLWGSHYFEGVYTADFSVDSNRVTNMYQINRQYELDFEGEGPKNLQIRNIGLSPVACTISVKMPENFNVNEAFNLVLNPHEDLSRDELYFLDQEGNKVDINEKSAFCSMWDTNGKFDAHGCELACEGAETTLLILFDNAVDVEEISGIHLMGEDIIFK
ncbi:MAG: hypothetical protein SPF70_09185 [Lachnospiraceae bacterium]|nr:hypothetical protein [Lachnospiraceae bacterium]